MAERVSKERLDELIGYYESHLGPANEWVTIFRELRERRAETERLQAEVAEYKARWTEAHSQAMQNGAAAEFAKADNERLREWLQDMDYDDGCRQCQINHEHERAALRGDPPRGTYKEKDQP